MEDCLVRKAPVPQWYVALENGEIIGGLGVIENDFHDRKDLSPNVCAVYTEKEKRCNGISQGMSEIIGSYHRVDLLHIGNLKNGYKRSCEGE